MSADDPSSGDTLDAEVVIAREVLLSHLVTFARALRQRGAEVSPDATLTGAQALATVGLDDRERVRVALRAALVSRHEDLERFEQLFPAFWRGVAEAGSTGGPDMDDLEFSLPDPDAPPEPETESETPPEDEAAVAMETRLEPGRDVDEQPSDPGDEESTAVYSPTGRSERVEATAEFGHGQDLDEAVEELSAALATIRGRRWSIGGDGRPDVRRALRRSVETGGTVVDLPSRYRQPAAVSGVLLVDVSRSVLDTIDRGFLVSFVRAVRSAWRDVAVFFFDTSVREVSTAFDAPSPAAALEALEAAEAAWGGGTRIGHAIETVRRRHPTRVDRDTVVLVISDGLEVGEIDVLERELAWLSQRAAAVLWANPLAASADYEPTCRGMAAAQPFLDGLFAFTGPADVAEMARQLSRYGPGDRVGFEFDARRPRTTPESDRAPRALGGSDGRA